jgi:hypothetical protein
MKIWYDRKKAGVQKYFFHFSKNTSDLLVYNDVKLLVFHEIFYA